MKHQYLKPHISITEYVKTILTVEESTNNDPLPVFPLGMSALVCLLEKEPDKDRFMIGLRITGQTVNPEDLSSCENFSLIAYFFRPFMSSVLFGMPAKKISGHQIHLTEWNRKKAMSLQEGIAKEKTTHERISLLNAFIMHQIRKNKVSCEIINTSINRIINNPGSGILSDIQKELKIQEKTLQRLFKKYVGVTPNEFRRVCQFHAGFQQLRSEQFSRLSDIAYEQQYADQSHFIRSFREFTDQSPHKYIKYGLAKRKK